MAASKFTAEMRADLLERFAAGVSVREAALSAGVNEKTLKSWLTKGRRQPNGPFAEFTAAVEKARESSRFDAKPMDEAELIVVVSEAARRGNTQAMKLRWEMLGRDKVAEEEPAADPLEALDELAAKRVSRAA